MAFAGARLSLAFSPADWLHLLGQFLLLSLLSIGGAIATVPDMQRTLVLQQHWLSNAQFTDSIALAQAAPGPNVLFVAVLGWNVGLNAGGGAAAGVWAWASAALGMTLAMGGILLPSTTLTLLASRWAHVHRERPAVRAFKQGMAPVVVGLMLGTGWLLAAALLPPSGRAWPLIALCVASTLLVWRTHIHLLWLLGAGTLLGALGWV